MADVESSHSTVHEDVEPPDPAPGVGQLEATYLSSYDVFSLIVNKMIGTGIYTSPSTVLLLTGDKRLALGLWGVGFLYTIMSMFIYLDYAAVFPYTGGELVYIDEVTSASGTQIINGNTHTTRPLFLQSIYSFLHRVSGNGLLAYTVYAFMFVGVFGSSTNFMQVGRELLISIHPSESPNRDLLRFIGVVTLSVVCLIQLFSARAGRILNSVLAAIKILFLLILLFFGCHYITKNGKVLDFNTNAPGLPALNYAQALLTVLYAYEGWENANFVAGEISTRDPTILRRGFTWAVFVVGILYMSLNAVFLCAIPFAEVKNFRDEGRQFNYAAMFSNNATSAQRAWAAVIALSAFGNANTVTYTFSRVKQSIGRANILPWSRLWKKDYATRDSQNGDRHKTPLGGLLLEWIFGVVTIAASASISGTLVSVGLVGNIQTYSHCFMLVILGLGLFRLRKREEDLGVVVSASGFPRISHARWPLKAIYIFIYCGMNMYILIVNALSVSVGVDDPTSRFKGKWFPTITLGLAGAAIVYYWVLFAAASTPTPKPFWNFSLFKLANASVTIRKRDNFDNSDEYSRRFGLRRIVNPVINSQNPYWRANIYWIFGGSIDTSPVEHMEDIRDSIKRWFSTIRGPQTTVEPPAANPEADQAIQMH